MPRINHARRVPHPKAVQRLWWYDPETGDVGRNFNGRRGKPITATTDKGYKVASLVFNGRKKQMRLHRIAFAVMNGRWPKHAVDHINRDRGDNAWRNLRQVTLLANLQNRSIGVRKNRKLWVASAGGTSVKYFKCFGHAVTYSRNRKYAIMVREARKLRAELIQEIKDERRLTKRR